MKTVMLVFGTRPEAIKMCPVIQALRVYAGRVRTVVCVTGQHREMLDQALRGAGVAPDIDLDIMRGGQSPLDVTARVLEALPPVLERVRPDLVLVHGDTASAFAAALACFYLRVPVGHVEAGLRTYDTLSPFPEEFDRAAIDLMSCLHFAPTERNREALLREGRRDGTIFVTGNTAIDALKASLRADFTHPALAWAGPSRLLVLTVHRRESLGEPMRQVFRAVRRLADERADVRVLYPVHRNPAIRAAAEEAFGGCGRVRMTEPLAPAEFHNILARAYLVLTDSGGIQEEAPSLGRPVLVLRDTTECAEGVRAGALRLVGTREADVYAACAQLLDDPDEYARMAQRSDLYGDGQAARRIAEIVAREVGV